MKLPFSIFAVILGLYASACSSDGQEANGPAGGGGDGTGGQQATGGGGTSSEVYASPCPESFPGAGACADEGAVCSYGSAGRYSCRSEVTCTAGTWNVSVDCDPPYPSEACSDDAYTGAACSTANARCAGPNGIECVCSGGAWACDLPVVNNPDCPPFVPNTGTACQSSAAGCQYMRCQASGTIEAAICENGVWRAATSSTCMTSDR